MHTAEPSPEKVLSYLRNARYAQNSGNVEQATMLLNKALEWLDMYDQHPSSIWEIGRGLHAGKRRTVNEDYLFADQILRKDGESVGLFVLADGVGGHLKGQEASQVAVHTFVDYVLSHLQEPLYGQNIQALLYKGVQEANRAVYQGNKGVESVKQYRLTTFTVALTLGTGAYIVSIGDSRAYLYRPGQGLMQLTRDHSVVADLVAARSIPPEAIYTHPERRIITRSLGEREDVDVPPPEYLSLHREDIVLLCSDGLWEMVRDPLNRAIVDVLATPDIGGQEMATGLVQLALNQGGLDNIGIIVARVHVGLEDMPTLLLTPTRSAPTLLSTTSNR